MYAQASEKGISEQGGKQDSEQGLWRFMNKLKAVTKAVNKTCIIYEQGREQVLCIFTPFVLFICSLEQDVLCRFMNKTYNTDASAENAGPLTLANALKDNSL